MGQKSSVRLVVSRNGYDVLKNYVENNLKENAINWLENNNVLYFNDQQYYIGWNQIKWYGNGIEVIEKGLQDLREKEYSYRMLITNERYGDIEEYYNDGENDKDIYLEYPSLNIQFEDEAMRYL